MIHSLTTELDVTDMIALASKVVTRDLPGYVVVDVTRRHDDVSRFTLTTRNTNPRSATHEYASHILVAGYNDNDGEIVGEAIWGRYDLDAADASIYARTR